MNPHEVGLRYMMHGMLDAWGQSAVAHGFFPQLHAWWQSAGAGWIQQGFPMTISDPCSSSQNRQQLLFLLYKGINYGLGRWTNFP